MSEAFAEAARATPAAFTRNRRLPLPRLLAFLVNAPRAGLQPELDAFFDHALDGDAVRPPTKSALCQARRQLRPAALRELVSVGARSFARHCEVEQWEGRRVLALDGTSLRVPDVPECVDHFGGMATSCGRFRPLARASALFDVARGCFLDGVLGGYGDDERTLARAHLTQLGAGDLVVMDRGYPSRAWLGELAARGIAYCVRMGQSWEAVKRFARGGLDDAVVDLGTPGAPLPARLLRAVLPNGSVFVLATNVFDAGVGPAAFADLYRGRWRIEEAFKLVKARLQVENWSGILPHTIEQDFYAALVRANCAAVLALAARPQDGTLGAPMPNQTGWRVRLNRTLVLKSLRHHLARLLLALDFDAVFARLLERLRAPAALERTRPQRTAPRNKKVRLAEFHMAYKAA